MKYLNKKSLVICAGLIGVLSCANNETEFTGAPSKPLPRQKPIDADATVGVAPATMVSAATPVETPVVTPSKDSDTQPVPVLPVAPPGPVIQPDPVSIQPVVPVIEPPSAPLPAPRCQLLASSYRIHQDSTVQITLHSSSAVSAALDDSAVTLDANYSASVFFQNVQADREFTGTVRSRDGQVGTCKVTVLVVGKWHKVQGQNCATFCGSVAADNIQDPQGGRCASGENQYNTLFNKFHRYYPYGTWGSGYGTFNTGSEGRYCYAQPSNMQKRDNDNTDIVTGCYCWDRR